MAIILRLTHIFNAIPIKIPARFFIQFDKLILKCIWKGKEPRLVKKFF